MLLQYNKWIDQQLKDAMDVVVQGHISLKKVSKFWNIPFNLAITSLQWQNQNKENGFARCASKPKDEAIVTWILNMRKVGLSIILQLELKVVEVTRTRPTPFLNGVLGIDWWYWFKSKHPKINIRIVKNQNFKGTRVN